MVNVIDSRSLLLLKGVCFCLFFLLPSHGCLLFLVLCILKHLQESLRNWKRGTSWCESKILNLLSSSMRGTSFFMWMSKPGISRVHLARSSFPIRPLATVVETEEVKRPSLFSEDFENISPVWGTRLKSSDEWAVLSFVPRISNLSVHATLMLGTGKTPVATQLRMIMSSSDEVEVNSREDGGTKQRNGSVGTQKLFCSFSHFREVFQ